MSPANEPNKTDNKSDKPTVEIDHDEPISSDYAYSEHHEKRWLQLIAYGLVALAFAVLVVFAGRWIYRKVTHKNTETLQPAGNKTPQAPSTSSQSSNNSSNSSSTSGSNNNSAQNTPSELTDTGPGNVIALFVGTAIIVGGLHFVLSLRRAE